MSLSSIIAALISGGGQDKRDEKQWNRWVEYQKGEPQRAFEKQRMLDLNAYEQKEASDEYQLGFDKKRKRELIPVDADATAAQTLGSKGLPYEKQAEIANLIASAMKGSLSNETEQGNLFGQVLRDPANIELLKASMLSKEAMPLANFKRGMTEEVGPGQYNRLNPTGVSNLDRLLGPNITLGSMSGVEQTPNIINGQQFGTIDRKVNYPPVRRPLEAAPTSAPTKIPLDPAKEQQALEGLIKPEVPGAITPIDLNVPTDMTGKQIKPDYVGMGVPEEVGRWLRKLIEQIARMQPGATGGR